MIVLDENAPDDQRALLRSKRVAARQIGIDVGRFGMTDTENIPLLLQLRRPTFCTRDIDFYKRRLCHAKYCLMYLDVVEETLAEYVLRVRRHPAFNTRAKRLGCVMRVSPGGVTYWRIRTDKPLRVAWE